MDDPSALMVQFLDERETRDQNFVRLTMLARAKVSIVLSYAFARTTERIWTILIGYRSPDEQGS